jgi:hypothetical protein
MNTNLLLMKLSTKRNGQYFNMVWASDVKMTASARKQGQQAVKIVTSTVRKGIKYSNMKSVRLDARENGDNSSTIITNSLPWGSWKPGNEGLLIEHNNTNYLRVYSSPNKPKSIYFLNGKEISKADLKAKNIVLDSYWSTNLPACFTVKVENIAEVL